ncbi:hypothetical protein TNCV_4603051 [Trichonephila clavipes]|nr:hypothetical protein TNCV_4603051 [Trichonephila clavipes]
MVAKVIKMVTKVGKMVAKNDVNLAPSPRFRQVSIESSLPHNMLTKYQMIEFIDFCEVWYLPESVARVAAIVGDHHCHTPRD